jgi:hypothetical protein
MVQAHEQAQAWHEKSYQRIGEAADEVDADAQPEEASRAPIVQNVVLEGHRADPSGLMHFRNSIAEDLTSMSEDALTSMSENR